MASNCTTSMRSSFWHQLGFMYTLYLVSLRLTSCRVVPPWSSAPDIFRRGVWLGRHIFYKTTKVSKDELSENRNLT